MNELRLKQISVDSLEYQGSLALRNEVLRRPIGRDIKDDDLSLEQNAYHFIALVDAVVVGTIYLLPLDKETWQMKQVAVNPEFQGKAIGKQLVQFAETSASEQGCQKIVLDARKNAWAFYQKQGYQLLGEEFTQLGIPHKKMEKILTTATSATTS